MSKSKKKVSVSDEEKEAFRLLEEQVKKISLAVSKMYSSNIQAEVIEHLISWKSAVPKKTVEKVLWIASHLDELILKDK